MRFFSKKPKVISPIESIITPAIELRKVIVDVEKIVNSVTSRNFLLALDRKIKEENDDGRTELRHIYLPDSIWNRPYMDWLGEHMKSKGYRVSRSGWKYMEVRW